MNLRYNRGSGELTVATVSLPLQRGNSMVLKSIDKIVWYINLILYLLWYWNLSPLRETPSESGRENLKFRWASIPEPWFPISEVENSDCANSVKARKQSCSSNPNLINSLPS